MTQYTWPDTRQYIPATAELMVMDNNSANSSPESGYVQTISKPGARWGWGLDFTPQSRAERAELEAWFTRLSGREHRVRLWDLKYPRPRGTCNLTGVTLGATAAQFATTVQLAGCGSGKTLLPRDWLGLPGGQLVMVVAAATANGSGAMTVEVRHMLRAALASGGAVVLDKPNAAFIRSESTLRLPRQPGPLEPGFSIQFEEVFDPPVIAGGSGYVVTGYVAAGYVAA
jgi:hypothetical protein